MDLVPKLNHSLPAVRERAWASLQFKLENGLLPDGFLSNCDRALVKQTTSYLLLDSGANHLLFALSLLNSLLEMNAFLGKVVQEEVGVLEQLAKFEADAEAKNPEVAQAAQKVAKNLAALNLPKKARSPIRLDTIGQLHQKAPRLGAHNAHNTHSRNRSLSPKKLPTLYPPTSSRFPVIPCAFPSYNFIHLSPIDEEAVSDFVLFLQQPNVNDEVERKLFHILITDFGSEIFLQRPLLFRLILSGLESENTERALLSQSYIHQLVVEWCKVFRRFVDGPFSLSSQTPISATPNVSITAAGAGGPGPFFDVNLNPPLLDSSLSIPFACHEIHFTLCRLISEGAARVECLETLNIIVPMLMLHLETVKQKSSHLDGSIAIDELCLDYIAAVLPCICFIGSSSSGLEDDENQLLPWKEKYVELVCVFIQAFEFVAVEPQVLLWKILHSLLNLPTSTQIPTILTRATVPSLDYNSAPILLKVIDHLHSWVRVDGYSELLKRLKSTNNISGGYLWLTNPVVQYTIVRAIYHDAELEVRAIASEIALVGIESFPFARFWMDFVQAFSDEDDLTLLRKVNDWYPTDLSFWLKGLFHRNERVREFSFNEMLKRFPDLSVATAFPDAVVFNQSILSMNPEREIYESKSNALDLQLLVTELRKREAQNMNALMNGLERLSTAVYDSSILMRLKDLQLLDILFACLIEKLDWLQRGQSLLHVLKICRILASFSLKQLLEVVNEEFLSQLVRPEYLFNANEFIRYEFSKLIFILLFNHYRFIDDGPQGSAIGVVNNGSLFVFDGIPQKYFVYTANEIISFKALDGVAALENVSNSVAIACKDYHVRFDDETHPVKCYMDNLFQRLRDAKSHEQFQRALDLLFGCVIFDADFDMLGNYPWLDTLGRFFLVQPASYPDERLLSSIIRHVCHALRRSSSFFELLKDMLFQAVSTFIVPILYSTAQQKNSSSNFASLSSDLVLLLTALLKNASQKDVGYILRNTNTLDALISYTYHIFSLECKDVTSHVDRISCLECLVIFARFPDFVHITSGQIGSAFIQLLVSVAGFSQQNYLNSTDGNAFTYQDRSIYRLVARSLRNISRCFVVLQSSFKNWLWGDHWLFEGDIEWLLILLNDDERIIQKYGLGILGNLILIKNSYPLLCLKIPQFLDMAFLYALDFERNYTLRKEALLIINNFLITFCHDNKISRVPLLPTSDESLADIDAVLAQSDSESTGVTENDEENDLNAQNKIADLLELFEHCGFFEQIRALITQCDKFTSIYMDALTGLLLNLFILSPVYMFQKLRDTDSWVVLLNFLGSTYSNNSEDETSQSTSSSTSSYSSVPFGLAKFRKNQFNECYSHFTVSLQCNILNIIRLTIAENNQSILQYLIFGSTGLLEHLKGLVNDATGNLKSERHIPTKNIAVVLHIISDVFSLSPSQGASFNLREWLETDETGFKIMGLCCFGFKKNSNEPDMEEDVLSFKKISCLLLARLLALHYSDSVSLNLHQTLSKYRGDSPERCLGETLTSLLLDLVPIALDGLDLTFVESLRICLQTLLSKFEAAKQYSVVNGVVDLFTNRVVAILNGRKQGKISEKHKVALHFSFCVLRHMFAGSVEAKELGYKQNIHKLVNESLRLVDLNEPLLLEILLCLQNAVTGCHHPHSLLDRQCTSNCSVVTTIRSIMKENSQLDSVFLVSVNILKIMVLQNEIRMALIKTSFLGDCLLTLKRLAKDKEVGKVTSLLALLRNFTISMDGQIHAIKTKGLFSSLLDLLSWKIANIHISCLAVLRNLATAKENKPFFLADENFLPQLLGLLDSCKTLPVADSITSFIWVLAYDSEKAKAALKSGRLVAILDKLEFNINSYEKKGSEAIISNIRQIKFLLHVE
ncbi:hypothetical protein BDR26DRAFT_855664 [Obelidium mucronatum]|nr:hypothetical protein BDR26DRAFT_855664 [Obelidium mucronatum]